MYSRLFTLLTVFAGLSCSLFGAEEKLRVETFKGKEITPYTRDLVKLSNAFFKEYPYLYEGNDADYTTHLESYAKSENAIVALTFDGNKVVGAATGMPLVEAWDKYQKALREKGYNVSSIYYLGELELLPQYQGKGFGQLMVKEIEKFAKEKKFTTLGTTQLDDSGIQHLKPDSYVAFEDRILSVLGFKKHPELTFNSEWTNVNESRPSPHTMIYWTKPIQ